MKTYFCTIQLETDEWVDIIYTSDSKRGSFRHNLDIADATHKQGIDIYKCYCNTKQNAYVMNKKNMDEQCFGDLRVVDCR